MEDKIFYEIFQYNNTIPVNIIQHTQETYGSSRSHWHNDLEIGLLIAGAVKCYIGGTVKEIRDGQIYLVNSGEVHCTIPQFNGVDNSAPGVTLVINYQFLKSIIPDLDNILFEIKSVRAELELSVLIFDILELYREKNTANEVRILGLVCQILYILLKEGVKKRAEINADYWKRLDQQKNILDYIHANYNKPLQQGEMAEQFHFSREYFCRFFKKYTGRTFKDYLTVCRLAHGEDMLRKSGVTVLKIAHDTGFPDEQTFIKEFKKQYGVTPGKYRKQWDLPKVKKSM